MSDTEVSDELNLYSDFEFDGQKYFYARRKGAAYQEIDSFRQNEINKCKSATLNDPLTFQFAFSQSVNVGGGRLRRGGGSVLA
jgi:hypothetical protein